MNYLSEKVQRLTPYVAGLQPQGEGWIKLNTNENPYPPSPIVTEAIMGADLAKLRLYPDGDSRLLCETIADTLCDEGEAPGVDADWIFCANGSDEVLALAFQAFFCGKGKVLSPDISYGFYPVWAKMYDVGMLFMPLSKDFTVIPSLYQNAEGVIIANPNAPTSLALSRNSIEAIISQNPSGVVIIDEAYIDFAEHGTSAVALTARYKNLLVVRTFSKSHSLAGLRVGYAIGNPALINGLRMVRDSFNSYPMDMLAQLAAAAATKDTEYLRETTGRIIHTRDKTISALQGMGYKVLPSQANFIFIHAKNAQQLYLFLEARKILVRYWNKPRINEFIRVTIGTDEEMEAFVQCMKEAKNA